MQIMLDMCPTQAGMHDCASTHYIRFCEQDAIQCVTVITQGFLHLWSSTYSPECVSIRVPVLAGGSVTLLLTSNCMSYILAFIHSFILHVFQHCLLGTY